jgi:DNA mismatch endonuclease (patch repair protein)
MTDRVSKEQRSKNMAAVRSSGNITTELALIKIFKKYGIKGWLRNQKILGIHPDFIFKRQRVAVFSHGCFWHGCKLHGEIPISNKKFWREKIRKNINRDERSAKKLKGAGWKVLCFWEHEIKKKPDSVARKVKKQSHSIKL